MSAVAGFDFSGKVALVTGAGRGIGRAAALHLAGAGAEVLAIARSADELDTLSKEAHGVIRPMPGDVREAETVRAVESLSALDILVNNAGTNKLQNVLEVDDDTLDMMIGLNIRAAFKIAQAAARVMAISGKGGSIVHVSSQMGHVGGPKRAVYAMTKHAIEGLTKSMALDLADQNIRVNAVAPTIVETSMTRPFFEDPAYAAAARAMIPLGRVATPDDIAAAILYLASDMAGFVTGSSLRIDGGATAM